MQETEGETVLELLTDDANTTGIGGEARTISDFFCVQTDNPVADLDEETLKSIADATGGNYFRATDQDSLVQICRQLETLESLEIVEQMVKTVTIFYHWSRGLGILVSQVLAIMLWREKSS